MPIALASASALGPTRPVTDAPGYRRAQRLGDMDRSLPNAAQGTIDENPLTRFQLPLHNECKPSSYADGAQSGRFFKGQGRRLPDHPFLTTRFSSVISCSAKAPWRLNGAVPNTSSPT